MKNNLLCSSPNLQVLKCESSKTRTDGSRKNVIRRAIVLPLSVASTVVAIIAHKFGLISRCRKGRGGMANDANISPQEK